ncbi:MAG: repeat-containing protein [Acidobacteriaceae bacterium]|nr:repeat-containing protein [Acidobacteriaceae bacterium]
MKRFFLLPLLITCFVLRGIAQQLTPHTLSITSTRSITLNLPASLTIQVAAKGLRRPRFFAQSPDHRIFVTDMDSLADNTRGAVYILDSWNPTTHTFGRTVPYLQHLRNPNNLAFYTDPATQQTWLYLPLTDRLVRYKYNPGDTAPTAPPEVLARYPDYGLSYKYGGWHLTRTIAFATLHGRTRLYVSVGSSCNACAEKEPIRATLSVMDPDGKNSSIVATGLRNAVGLSFVPRVDGGSLFATNMGADHLGDRDPEDQFFELDSNDRPGPIYISHPPNYGWPTCFFDHGTPHPDPLVSAPKPGDHIFPPPPAGPPPPQFDCAKVPAAYTAFAPHSSPLGLEYFDATSTTLGNTFLVALHGAGHPRVGSGYRVVRIRTTGSHTPEDFITGFLSSNGVKFTVHGRPCGILRTSPDSFLLTDDRNGVIYSIYPKQTSPPVQSNDIPVTNP